MRTFDFAGVRVPERTVAFKRRALSTSRLSVRRSNLLPTAVSLALRLQAGVALRQSVYQIATDAIDSEAVSR